MYYVYLIESLSNRRRYIGLTSDLKERIREHNAGSPTHTWRFRPGKRTPSIPSNNGPKPEAFDRYLKPGPGHAFAKGVYGDSLPHFLIPSTCHCDQTETK